MSWLFLIIAGLCEMGFVITMKLSNGFKVLSYSILTIIIMTASFFLLSLALKTIPLGTAYAIWTGIGALGSVIAGMILFKEKKSTAKTIFIGMIIAGIIGLKLSAGT
ncbi:MAG: multidrug efflux SMR transporter [Candidatus Azobacteroides sp.]|nr:multidrug efflux SMR transporter [Candidatus Azobacteroides sp.]